ncbi:hypothetical protein AAFC00_006568 [Neodothiora populina]|uniref:HAUS augmin-like complex subunit 1 n=1 Tax=Neodothiora populina TaxID=2781224 RepID=A0ABR3PAM2_9PEZI
MDLSSALFSPSKARQQQAQAKDWVLVDSWLSRKYYPKPVPSFERNEYTLQALMTLVAFSERADDEEGLLHNVELQAFRELEEKTPDETSLKISATLESSLSKSSQAALQTLSEVSVTIDRPHPDPQSQALHLTTLTSDVFHLSQSLAQTKHLLQTAQREQRRLKTLLDDVASEAFVPAPDLPAQTATFTRDTKLLSLKLDEYNERLAHIASSAPHGTSSFGSSAEVSISELENAQAQLRGLKVRVADVEARIKWFEDLPSDVGAARRVLEGLKGELKELVAKRNEGFERLLIEAGKDSTDERGNGRSRLPLRK